MSYVQDLKALLEPMGVYRLEGSLNGGALTAAGEALDQCGDELAQIQREMLLTTAEILASVTVPFRETIRN